MENQDKIHYAMAVKNMLYDALQYAKQVEESKRSYRDNSKTKEEKVRLNSEEFLSGFRKADRLMPVVTLVVYFGDKEWDGAKSIHEMLSVDNEKLLSYIPDYSINLIEPAKISRIEYFKSQETIDIAADAKSVRLDIYVEDAENTVYNVEMQTAENRNLPKRTRYYQWMIDLNILEKGENYKNLKKSFVIFVCTFDLFGEGRHIYTFENRCIENLQLPLGDETVKIILNTKGTMDNVKSELKSLLDYIDGEKPKDEYTRELEDAVNLARKNEK